MRSSKSRSRSKANRSRSMGNITNRVFDSSGPEGKVRGTPQQIIDKYTQLARDAQLSNDRVAAENFQQHAEHYTRMLGDAQREMEARREQQQNQQGSGANGQNAGQGGGQQSGQQNAQNVGQQAGQHGGAPTALAGGQAAADAAPQGVEPRSGRTVTPVEAAGTGPQPDLPVVDAAPGQTVSAVVETGASEAGAGPEAVASAAETAVEEATAKPRRRSRAKPAASKAKAVQSDDAARDEEGLSGETESASTLVETPEDAPKPRRTRARAKPKAKEAAPAAESDPGEAAE
ncbi:MAG: DUF4167 domain-containing protein [Pseudomonadota bacterium]